MSLSKKIKCWMIMNDVGEVKQIAELMGLSYTTARRMIKQGEAEWSDDTKEKVMALIPEVTDGDFVSPVRKEVIEEVTDEELRMKNMRMPLMLTRPQELREHYL